MRSFSYICGKKLQKAKKMKEKQLTLKLALEFIFGGNSTFTVVSKATNKRFTFKVKKGKSEGSPFFVSYLFGNDNSTSYKFLGTIFIEGQNAYKYILSRKYTSKDSQINKTFDWLYKVLTSQDEKKFELIEFWHEGKCGQCGRKLTVPSSIESGYGPVCAKSDKTNLKAKIRENALDFLLKLMNK